MTPGAILHDPQFLCHDKTQQNKLLVVLNDGSAGNYILVKTTSSGKKKSSAPGCHPRDRFRNFFIPKGQSDFPEDTWVMLDEFYEFDRKTLLQQALSKYIKVKGQLPQSLIKSLLVCAKDSPDITPAQEAILDDALTRLALNMSIESTKQPPQPEPDKPKTGAPIPLCPTCSHPLDPQSHSPRTYWCGICRMWFDGELKRL
jgi:hypothetical protein